LADRLVADVRPTLFALLGAVRLPPADRLRQCREPADRSRCRASA
jgi:hypothetical protein